jgi:hypothetical protein
LLEQLKAHKPELLAVFRDAETVVEEGRQPAQVSSKQTLSDPEARKLLAAGWEPKERCGKVIWERPDKSSYCSQELAAHFLDRGDENARYKSGANREG